MDHHWELLIPILEILEIEVFNILYKPGNIGNLSFWIFSHPGNIGKHIMFSTSSYPGNIGKRISSIFSYPGNIGKRVFSNFSYPGNIGNLFFPISSYPGSTGNLNFIIFYYPGNIWILDFQYFLIMLRTFFIGDLLVLSSSSMLMHCPHRCPNIKTRPSGGSVQKDKL